MLSINILTPTTCSCENVDVKKIGNLIIYLSNKFPNLYLTRLLKLLYIIDEQSVLESGMPITNLNFHVWEKGPVARPIYYCITFEDYIGLSEYIQIESNEYGKKITPKKEFDDSEFSDYEIKVIDSVLEKTATKKTEDLIDALHGEDTLWSKIVKEKKLQPIFDNKESNTSPYIIDLSELIKDNPVKLNIYNHFKESKIFEKSF